MKWICHISQCNYMIDDTDEKILIGAISHYKKYHADEHYTIQ